jgi:glycolate oxidase iron-sulfur subunit
VVLVADEQCCGSLTHHMGRDGDALARAKANIEVWTKEIERGGLDAIIVTTSGCGTTIKDYGYMLREDKAFAAKAARISALAKDVTEYVASIDVAWPQSKSDLVVAYHSACSLQHGQKITQLPKELLSKSGFVVKDVPRVICVAVRRERTTSSSPTLRSDCANGRSPTSHRRSRTSSPPATSVAWCR